MTAEDFPVNLANYCACFIDLLGQKKAMEGESLLPDFDTPEQYEALIRRVKSSVGKIVGAHKHAESMLNAMQEVRDPPGPLNPEQLAMWRSLRADSIVTQRWSDGLMVYTCLGTVPIYTQVNSIYAQFCLAGTMCLVGLAAKGPMRGGIDIAWGVELNKNELYGPVVANAYILESECASFPRIVVGEQVDHYLTAIAQQPGDDIPTRVAREMARRCRRMVTRDEKGVLFLDYLSPCFEEGVTAARIDLLWERARGFIESERVTHTTSGDEKLAGRYRRLADYFDSRPPPSRRNVR